MNYDEAFKILIGHEGGYVNNPNDPGGETKYGISKRSYPNVDIRNLTLDQAKAIYKRDFWDAVKADQLPAKLRFHIFDAAVNSGVGAAVKWLQGAVGVVQDGKLGPVTLNACVQQDPVALAINFNLTRLNAMTDMKGWVSFSRGWTKRIISNIRSVL